MNSTKYAAVICIAVGCGAVTAQVKTGYMGIEGGYSSIADQSDDLKNAAVSAYGGTATATQKTSVASYRIYGGMDVNDKVSLELGYLGSSTVTSTLTGRSSGAVNYSLDIGLKLTGYDYSVLWFPNRTSTQRGGFLRFGGHSTKLSGSGSIVASGNTYSSNISDSGTGLQFGFGYEGGLTKTIDYRVGVSRYNKVAGESGTGFTVLSAGLISRF
jgi:hypothetical protein